MSGDGEERWQDMACHVYITESKQVDKKKPWETADGNRTKHEKFTSACFF